MALMIEQFICRTDNFGVLIHDPDHDTTAAIDAPDLAALREHLARRHWRLDRVFTTHHHGDHTEANLALKREFGCTIVGPAGNIPGRDEVVQEGDSFVFGTFDVRVLATPGHTLDHLTYWIPVAGVAFVGDTLFAMGCGRIIEGTPGIMAGSLTKLMALPDDTDIYCGHEYTMTNARFALTVEPDNADLVARARQVAERRGAGQPTLPTTIILEKQTNPFVRTDQPGIRQLLGMGAASDVEVFAELRKRKDSFK